jgi:hypothetical protein
MDKQVVQIFISKQNEKYFSGIILFIHYSICNDQFLKFGECEFVDFQKQNFITPASQIRQVKQNFSTCASQVWEDLVRIWQIW